MTRAGGGLAPLGSLVLLSLCAWTGARTAAPGPVRNLTVWNQTNSSISLRWAPPGDPSPENHTYWVRWAGEGKDETRNTTDVTYTAEGLAPASLYAFSVWVEGGGASSHPTTLIANSAPNPVGDLTVESRTTSSITLRWEPPHGPNRSYTYWVQWTDDGNKTGTQSTADTRLTVDALKPWSSYELAVWVENMNIRSSRTLLRTATGFLGRAGKEGLHMRPQRPQLTPPPVPSSAPNPVRDLTVENRTNSSITLRWAPPDTQSYTYWVQYPGDGKNETRNSTDVTYTVEGLTSATSYPFSVWAERHGVPSAAQTQEGSTAPSPVGDLTVESRTTSSLSLRWGPPHGPDRSYTYWVQWTGGGGETGTRSTADTRVTVDGLKPGSAYELAVWVENRNISGSRTPLRAATVPHAVTSLRIGGRTTSSIALSWTAPQGPDQPPYTYWVSWTLEGGAAAGPQSTPDTRITVSALEAGSLYTFTVWAERNGVNSNRKTLLVATAPNEVTALQTTTQTNNSIALQWEAPADPRAQLYVYCVQWAGGGDPQREADPKGHKVDQIARTSETWYVVEALEPGTPYNFSVWAERSDVAGSTQRLRASTAPDPVTITSCTSISSGYGLTLTWTCPPGGYVAFELQVGGQQGSWDRASCGRGVSVWDLQPAQSYVATVRTLWDGLRAPSASVTCHTESAGVIAGSIVGVLLFLTLVGLLVFFLRRYIQSRE
ncbi:receptor-type tyrosine-protein phosphatase H-like [Eptesicus fuscus]|uniref:receptor-type tyrosine-protein phosphatase H-like n=1 Tax=Eptesicus fuscus TaxID=29078 RepID=UPI002403FF29|nr:receptor-type tyrosine-protein phosphatase H-like [Eptesicus fuscus]